MENSKAIRLLKRIPTEDLSEFRDFAASPLFNKDAKLLEFVERLLADLPDVPSDSSMIAALFPEESDVPTRRMDRLRNRMVALIRAYVDFRAKRRPEDAWRHQLSRIMEWQDLGETGIAEKEAKSLLVDFEKENGISGLRHWSTFRLRSYVIEKQMFPAPKSADRYQNAYNALFRAQAIERLRILCARVNAYRVRNHPVENWAIAEGEDLLSIDPASGPLVRIYQFCLRLQLDPGSASAYEEFGQELLAQAHTLSRAEAHDLFQYAINHQIRIFNRDQSNQQAAGQLLALYEGQLQNGLLLEEGGISAWNYKNIVSIMGRTGNLEWLRKFMQEYEPQLLDDYMANGANFCRGVLAFYEKNYRETALRMDQVLTDFRNVFWGLEARALLMQAHFERGRYDDVESAYHSARMYARRKGKYQSYNNFYLALYRLSKILAGDRDHLQGNLKKLEEEIQAMDYLPNSIWIRERIDAAQKVE